MNLRQLRYIQALCRNQFSVSQSARILHTSQPGVSSQIKLLEEELGTPVFERHGKRLIGLTEAGEEVARLAEIALTQVDQIKQVTADYNRPHAGTLTIATTHTQARYALPAAITAFRKLYPAVALRIRQGNPTQISEMVIEGEADLAIATEGMGNYPELLLLPVYQWNRYVIAPPGHPIFEHNPLSLETIAQYPIITYDFAFTGRSVINSAFATEGLTPDVVLTAIDSDVIKHYVSLGLGVGILAKMAYDGETDSRLVARDASHLFKDSVTSIGVRRGRYLRQYIYEFIHLFAPQLKRRKIEEILHTP